jgi:hypothetical protein
MEGCCFRRQRLKLGTVLAEHRRYRRRHFVGRCRHHAGRLASRRVATGYARADAVKPRSYPFDDRWVDVQRTAQRIAFLGFTGSRWVSLEQRSGSWKEH